MAKRAPQKRELAPEVVERIRASIAEWAPGKWAEEHDYGPACVCGLGRPGKEPITCHRHPVRGSSAEGADR